MKHATHATTEIERQEKQLQFAKVILCSGKKRTKMPTSTRGERWQ